MQLSSVEMSAGGHERGRINRIAVAIEKANIHIMKNDSNLRAMANRAIMQELDNNMKLTASKMKLTSRTEHADLNLEGCSIVEGGSNIDRRNAGVQSTPVNSPSSSKIPTFGGSRTRQKQAKPRPVRKQRNVIQDYRPGYTWNRGGRVKELRIRCLARKYCHFWKYKAFGRVLPSTAREHYRRHLLKQSFSIWSEMWWEVRREWALTVRADLHNRYRIWNKVWHAWREYTLIARVKTIQNKIADHHAKVHICGRVIQAWEIYIEMRHTKKALYRKADGVFRDNIRRQFWHRWQYQYELSVVRKHQEVAALQHWADNIISKAWCSWKRKFLEGQYKEHQYELAVANRKKALVRQCFYSWRLYIESRRCKLHNYDRAIAWHRRYQLKRHVNIWYDRYCLARQLVEHDVYIEDLSRRARCRRVLVHWKFYVHLRREIYKKKVLATAHYRTCLQKSTIAVWKLYVSQQRIKVLRHQVALEHYRQTLVRRVWIRWLERCEEREDGDMVAERQKARHHYYKSLMMKAWWAWTQYVEWRRHRKDEYMRADVFYITQALPKYLNRWRSFAETAGRKREIVESAASFRRENLLARFFYQWHDEYEHSQDIRLAERMAILHHEELVKRRLFAQWWFRTQEVVEENFKMTVSDEHYKRSLCKSVLRHWKGITVEKKQMIGNTRLAVRRWYICLMGKAIRGWKIYLSERHHKRSLKRKAECHQHQKLLRLTFTRWQHYHGWWGEISTYADTKMKEKNQQLLRFTINIWHANVQESRLEREKIKIAVAQYNITLLQKVMASWHQHAVMHGYKKQKSQELVQGAKAVLNKGKLQRSIQRWQEMTQLTISQRRQNQIATSHYGRTLVIKAWRAWHEAISVGIRKQLLMRQAMWMHNKRLTAQSFRRWKAVYSESLNMKNKTNLALWHWCLNLQHKVLLAWITYMAEKRRKGRRMAEALQARRTRLLRDGVTQWLCLAAGMAEIRQKYAVEREAQNYYHLNQVVLRCASHWRHLAAKHKLERADSGVAERASKRIRQVHRPVKVVLPEPCMSPGRDDLGRLAIPRARRAAPRKPEFLLESLKREGLYKSHENGLGCHTHNFTSGAIVDNGAVLPSSEKRCFPSKEATSDESRFVGFETSTSVGAQRKSGDTQTADNITVSNTSHLDTSNRNPTLDVFNKLTYGKIAADGQRSFPGDGDADLEPRPPPRPSLEHRKEIDFERSDELNISTSVITGCQSDVTGDSYPDGAGTRSGEMLPPGEERFRYDGDCMNTSQSATDGIALLPPVAFMFRKDGTLIQNHTDHKASIPETHMQELVASAMPAHAGNPEHSRTVDDKTLLSPADELVMIRKRLKEYQQWKKQLKRNRTFHHQLTCWMKEQSSRNIQTGSDPLLRQIQEEITILEDEIKMLSEKIEGEKPNIRRLTDTVEQLLTNVTMSA